MLLGPLALALSIGSTAAAPCSQGDAPLPMHELASGTARVSLRVDDDGVGHLHLQLPWTNDSEGPASATTIIDDDGLFAVVGARIGEGRNAAFVEAAAADTSWEGFLSALRSGVAAEEVKSGSRRFGVRVHTVGDAITVDVAGACSARSLVVELEALLDLVPAQGGWRYLVPAGLPRSTLKVEVPEDHSVYVDGKRRARASHEFPTDAAFVVDVGRTGRSLHARGGATVLVPRPALLAPQVEGGVTTAPALPTSTEPFTLLRAAVDLPRPLSAAPPELRIVFVVDNSVSAGDNGVAMAMAIVNSVLDQAPDDVGWALVTSSRTPALLVPPWRSRHWRHLPTIRIENGSNVVAAVDMAQNIASDAIPGSARVVVLSDLQLKDADVMRLPVQVAAAGLHGALVHVVQLPADVESSRDFGIGFDRIGAGDDVRAAAAEGTGGVLLNAYEGGAVSVVELGRHLVRPTRLDHPVILIDGRDAHDDATSSTVRVFDDIDDDGDDGDDDDGDNDGDDDGDGDIDTAMPMLLHEGGGLRASLVLPGRAHHAVVVGSLWATRVELPLRSTKAGHALNLFVMVNHDLKSVLDDDQVRAAAHAGHFVSRVTSFVDVPSWRPAEPDYRQSESCGCGGYGWSSGCSFKCGRHPTGSGNTLVLSTQQILDAIADEAAEQCQVKTVSIDVEFGDREILDVSVAGNNACVSAWVWEQRLDQRIHDTSFEHHQTLHASNNSPAQVPTASNVGPP